MALDLRGKALGGEGEPFEYEIAMDLSGGE